jgi:hypothetical protein
MNPDPMCRRSLQKALQAVIARSAVIDTQWQGLRRRGLPTMLLPGPVRQTVLLLARRAERNCGRMIDRAITGLAQLSEGDHSAGGRALVDCLKMIRFDKAADREAARLLRATKTPKLHGRH